MKRTLDEHAARFDGKAPAYDGRDRPVYQACADRVVEFATPEPSQTVLDLGTGTGAIALRLAERAHRVVGRDISTGMLTEARRKADTAGVTNVSFDTGSFREPNYDGPADVVTSNFAMHHLDDPAKREAIEVIARYRPERFVLGDVMLFADAEPDEPAFDPTVDDPATVGMLAAALTAVGFEIARVEAVTDQAGVILGRRPREGWPA